MNAAECAPESSARGFFVIDRNNWIRVCKVGLNPAIAYLVLACGSGRDNSYTTWSAQAIEKYTAISRGRAKDAICELEKNGFLKPVSRAPRPTRRLCGGGEQIKSPIWLPNTLVAGAAGETPPIELVRQIQDVMALRLFIELYEVHDLTENGGVSRTIWWEEFERERLGERAGWAVWGFRGIKTWVTENDITRPHYRPELGERRAQDFFQRFNTLISSGLVEVVPTLFESGEPTAEEIHAVYGDSSNPLEVDIACMARKAAEMMLHHEGLVKRAANNCNILAPVPKHIRGVQVIGIGRLRYRPHTQRTAAWWADLNERGQRYLVGYQRLADGDHRFRIADTF